MKRLRSVQSIKVRVNFYKEEAVYFETSHPRTHSVRECFESVWRLRQLKLTLLICF